MEGGRMVEGTYIYFVHDMNMFRRYTGLGRYLCYSSVKKGWRDGSFCGSENTSTNNGEADEQEKDPSAMT